MLASFGCCKFARGTVILLCTMPLASLLCPKLTAPRIMSRRFYPCIYFTYWPGNSHWSSPHAASASVLCIWYSLNTVTLSPHNTIHAQAKSKKQSLQWIPHLNLVSCSKTVLFIMDRVNISFDTLERIQLPSPERASNGTHEWTQLHTEDSPPKGGAAWCNWLLNISPQATLPYSQLSPNVQQQLTINKMVLYHPYVALSLTTNSSTATLSQSSVGLQIAMLILEYPCLPWPKHHALLLYLIHCHHSGK